ncbi:hypothetical protein C4579_01505 [Candidatus Microgenomates bacterium]|nr:MAG: hypothetical protein C4579_01505 [Candidatus Microgenomates bacterium]
MKKVAFALLTLLFFSLFFLQQTKSVFAAGRCGLDVFIDNSGQAYTTGCYIVNVGGQTVPDSNWTCPGAYQCFITGTYQTGNINAQWTLLNNPSSPFHGQPAVCIGGFTSETELRNHRISLSCSQNCGGYVSQALGSIFSSGSQTVDFNSVEIGTGDNGTYYTCITGNISDAIATVITDYITDRNATCVVSVLGAGLIFGGVSGGAGIPLLTAAVTTASGTITGGSICSILLSEVPLPIIDASVFNKNNNNLVAVARTNFQLDFTDADGNPVTIGEVGNTENETSFLKAVEICKFSGETDSDGDGITEGPCGDCVRNNGVLTAFGCIPANPQDVVERLLQIAIAIAGGIAFLMICYAGITLMLAGSNPEQLNHGKEILLSAISGLFLIIFSVVILRIIGVDILQIPGL